jgi:hypothetical protein
VLVDRFVDGSVPEARIDVPAVPLADAIGQGCDLLKLDCEGSEFELLLDTPADALRRARRIVAEFHVPAGEAGSLAKRLGELGYEAWLERKEHPGLGLLLARRT